MSNPDAYLRKRRANHPQVLKEAEATYTQLNVELEQQREELLENHARIGKALNFLSEGLRPFIEQTIRKPYANDWMNQVRQTCLTEEDRRRNVSVNLDDSYTLLKLIIKFWQGTFDQTSLRRDKNLVYDLRDVRNDWAHPKTSEWKILEKFTARYTYTALTQISLLLSRIKADDQAKKVDRIKQELEQKEQQKPSIEIDLYGRALALLNEQLELSSNALTGSDRQVFQRDDIYIPLGLVERQARSQRQSESDTPERGADLYRETEILRSVSEEDFFNQVLQQGQSQSQGRRVAIIGEAGSGKTTRLQAIAEWIFENPLNTGDVAIWIPLGAIGKKPLREYLLQDWLRDAAGSLGNPPLEWQTALETLLSSGKLWLLLDGVDEMAVASPLQHLAEQLRQPWARSVRVVLTCRLNVWEANKNALYAFDVFRNLDFSPDQVNDFITRSLGEPGQALQTALQQPGKERIRNLVKNPLRLMLLCRLWQQGESQLPDTKAGLYAQFVQQIYDWKAEIILNKYSWTEATYHAKQLQLNRALGELAKRAIKGETSRFRLSERFVQQVMDEVDPELLGIAKDIGWLNVVGVAVENPLETVYAFYHPTFEEYFAALEIEDDAFFLAPDEGDYLYNPRKAITGTYHVLEPQWREVFLFWLGRDDINSVSKKILINRLLRFEGYPLNLADLPSFYYYQAWFLAGVGIGQFIDCQASICNAITWQLCQWAFGYFHGEKKQWIVYQNPIREGALSSLRESNSFLVLDDLNYLLKHLEPVLQTQDFETICKLLEPLDPGSDEEISMHELYPPLNVTRFIPRVVSQIEKLKREIAGEEPPSSDEVKFNKLLARFSSPETSDDGIEPPSKSLTELLEELDQEDVNLTQIAREVQRISPRHPKVIASLTNQLHSFDDWEEDDYSIFNCAYDLVEIDPGNPDAIVALIKLRGNDSICDEFPEFNTPLLIPSKYLPVNPTDKNYPKVVRAMWQWLDETDQDELTWAQYDCWFQFMWHCAQNLTYQEFHQALHGAVHPRLFRDPQIIESLNQQRIPDVLKQLEATDSTYPFAITLQVSPDQGENTIAQRLWNRLFEQAYPEEEIPSVEDLGDLEQAICHLETQLELDHLAVIFYNTEPQAGLVSLLQQVSDRISIGWITDQPVPFRSFQAEPLETLASRVQNWVNDL